MKKVFTHEFWDYPLKNLELTGRGSENTELKCPIFTIYIYLVTFMIIT